MKTSIQFCGKRSNPEWPHFAWSVNINGMIFEYKTGIGHATPKSKRYGEGWNPKPKDKATLSIDNEWVHIPTIDSVLECLFSDYDAGTYSFNEFCGNFGYDSDSLKALDTYRACMEYADKLHKALGAEFQAERARIEALRG
jgi:hypothetical protein